PDTVDPLAGSYFVENLTDEIEAKATELIEKIDLMGGSVAAIEEGFIQDEIARSAYEYQRQIEDGSKWIVGVNKFQIKEETKPPLFKIDDSIRQLQMQKLMELKQNRDAGKVKSVLHEIKRRAISGENLMPAVIEAVEAKCTLGEIANELRGVFGEYQ
ncbi:MAG: methylmalonyl-CoA mutase family protein, partial [Alphaproteobacteria bacterium]